MLKTLAVDKRGNILTDINLERLKDQDIAWYWVDFENPTRSEINLLSTFIFIVSISCKNINLFYFL